MLYGKLHKMTTKLKKIKKNNNKNEEILKKIDTEMFKGKEEQLKIISTLNINKPCNTYYQVSQH